VVDQVSPAVISRLPLGLLGFLGLKNGGAFPQNIERLIRTTLDQLGFLVANHSEGLTFNYSITGTGDFIFFTVPSGEVWYVDRFSFGISTSAAQTFGGVIRHSLPGTSYIGFLAAELTLAVSQFGNSNAGNFWIGPGQTLGVIAHVATGTPIGGASSLRILRMTI
jgi:hypothetical protein